MFTEEVALTDVGLKLNDLRLQEFFLVLEDVQFFCGCEIDDRAVFEE